MAITRYSDAAANAMLDSGLIPFINSGAGNAEFEFYNGTILATGETAITTQTLLATIACSDPVEAGAAASRVVNFDTITGANAVDDGTGTFAILNNANGDRVAVYDVGNLSSTAAIKLGNTTFTTGLPSGLTGFTISVPVTLTA